MSLQPTTQVMRVATVMRQILLVRHVAKLATLGSRTTMPALSRERSRRMWAVAAKPEGRQRRR